MSGDGILSVVWYVVGKRAVVLGIPGVGKTTVVSQVLADLRRRNLRTESVVFGTVMWEEAQREGIRHRDEMRRLPVPKQRALQQKAARTIAQMNADILLVDTHLFIRTPEGFWPGLPADVLQVLAPTHLILVEASPQEILARRQRDQTRYRDRLTHAEIEEELQVARQLLGTAAVLTGAPMLLVENVEGKVERASNAVVQALGAA